MAARRTTLLLLALLTLMSVAACPSAPVVQQAPPEPAPPVVVEEAALEAVEHFGPMSYAPAVFDCGFVLEGSHCRFDVLLENTGSGDLTIVRVRQDVSGYGAIGLVEDSTGFSRDLPYDMNPGELLRMLFEFRRDDPNEQPGGHVHLDYSVGGRDYEIAVPVRASTQP